MAETGAEKPAEEKQGAAGAADHAGGAPEAKPEEVEAEIVDAEFSDAPGEASEAPAAEEKVPPRPVSLLDRLKIRARSGFLAFAVFVVVAIAAFLLFLISRPAIRPPAQTPAAEALPEAAPERTAPAREEPAPAPAASAETGAGKIANALPSEAKESGAKIDMSGAPASARGLPPPPAPGSANEALQQAAKEALKTPGLDEGDAIDAAPETAPGPGIEFKVEGAGAEPQAGERPPAEEVPPPEARAAPGAGEGEAAAAEETARLASLQRRMEESDAAREAEIAALRASFQQALAEREARANAEIAALRTEVERLRADLAAGPSLASPEAAIALSALQRAVDRGDPYTNELERFERYAPKAPAIARLKPMAAEGAPTVAALQRAFDPAARAALAAASREGAKGWLSALLARLPQFVSVRPASPQPGHEPAAIMSRAEARLEKGDVAGAAGEIESLSGAAAEAFAPWLRSARARLAADGAIDELETAFLAGGGN